jgi:hypothetical protein
LNLHVDVYHRKETWRCSPTNRYDRVAAVAVRNLPVQFGVGPKDHVQNRKNMER